MKKKLILGILISIMVILTAFTSVYSANVNPENIMQINTVNQTNKEQENNVMPNINTVLNEGEKDNLQEKVGYARNSIRSCKSNRSVHNRG